MKTVTLESLIQKARAINTGLIALPNGGTVRRNWPLCMTCGRDVDAANLEAVSNKGCEIRAWCHGKEEAMRIVWNVPKRNSADDYLADPNIGWAIKRAMEDFSPFDPNEGHLFDVSHRR